MKAVLQPVFNRGSASPAFIQEMANWAKTADDCIFAESPDKDIYGKVRAELGPYGAGIILRKAIMIEVMRVLGLFESGSGLKAWECGIDETRATETDDDNAEAGRWQVSYDSRNSHPSLRRVLAEENIHDGITFQKRTKKDHAFAMKWVAMLMRHNTKHNGPLYKGKERLELRESVREEKHSIYPYLSRESVLEIYELLLA